MQSKGELSAALWRHRSAWLTVAALSAALNILVLGGSVYLMMIYDSVLPSHSLPTLIGLFLLISMVYVFQGLIDLGRTRILSSIGESLEEELGSRVQHAVGELSLRSRNLTGDGLVAMRDLDQIRSFLTSGGPPALLDLPWVIFFIGVLALLHPWLGAIALAGALVLVGLTVLTHRIGSAPTQRLAALTAVRSSTAESNLRHIEILAALGMRETMHESWKTANRDYLAAHDSLNSAANQLGTIGKVFRLFLQSAILTVGAWLVIRGQASGGVIFAASLLSGRALAPVDQTIANWRGLSAARAGWQRLDQLLRNVPPQSTPDVRLPLPTHELLTESAAVAPPGSTDPTIIGVSFRLQAGEALGVIGPSGAGKSSLARALVGIWPTFRGNVRLDGATLHQWHPERLGTAMGYLPQSVDLFAGTIAQNIARFSPYSTSEAVISAAREAGVHDMIVAMPMGYETQLGREGIALSAGQRQRIGLARALYGRPFVVVLDEPNSNLDQDGESALDQAIANIRARKGIAVIITHRPALLARTSHVLFLRGGRMEAFGPRDEVMSKVLRTGEPASLHASESGHTKAAA